MRSRGTLYAAYDRSRWPRLSKAPPGRDQRKRLSATFTTSYPKNGSLAIIAIVLVLAACGRNPKPAAAIATGGDPDRGMAAISRYGCGSCHTVAGIPSAHGLVGPPLTGIRDRMFIAGMLNNEPGNLIHWIQDPKSVNPKTAMPKLGLSARDATDIAAYLYSQ